MNRRTFLQNVGCTAATLALTKDALALDQQRGTAMTPGPLLKTADVTGHTLVAGFDLDGLHWKAYEDLRTREGAITFISPRGARVMAKSAEAAFPDEGPAHFGITMDDIGMSGPDLLADKLLAGGDDPDAVLVMKAAPPQGSRQFQPREPGATPPPQFRPRWDNFIGTVEAYDTQPVFPLGNTKTYHPSQHFAELTNEAARKRSDGFVGGWMPAVRKVFPLGPKSYLETICFGDVEAPDKFIVQSWHRSAKVEDGKTTNVVYGHTYPEYPPARTNPKPEDFYRALLVFANYWDGHLKDFAATSLPDQSWVDIAKHCFAKELMVRPGGVYPKYGAVDRDYYGNEYDGFQDIFTMALYTNLECGRFEQARKILDNYFNEMVDAKGMINMRGPETAQFGMTLSLAARYYNYTGDAALLTKHRAKILATVKMLEQMHETALKLPADDPGYGIIHGWSESDACLARDPSVWWLPYYANNAWTARGLFDLARTWEALPAAGGNPASWKKRAQVLREATVATMEKNVWRNEKPPYIGIFPGAKMMFRESMAKERPSPHQWAHRPYAELLQADVLPPALVNTVLDTMRAYGATTIGVCANVGAARPGARAILGFISYGHAQALLRMDRVEEYLLFLYAHRYHNHTRGGWVAGEVSGINGDTALFCIPAQQTLPLLVRWMLVLEDSDADRLYFGKGVPRAWVASGKPISINGAPTRWGRVNLKLQANPEKKMVTATVDLPRLRAPQSIEVKLRVPKNTPLQSVTVNGRAATLSGKDKDTVAITSGTTRHFEVVGTWA